MCCDFIEVVGDGKLTLQEADEKGPAAWPAAGRRVVVAKDEAGVAAVLAHDEQDDEDDQDGGGGPVDANLVDEVEVAGAKGVDEGADEHDGPEAQDRLPGVCDVVLVEDGDGAEDELRAAKVDGQGDGPVADEGEPAVDEADEGRPAARREHGAPVVDAAGGGEDGADLGEGGGDADGDEGDEDPAPEHGDGLPVGEGDVHGRGEAVGDRHDGEGEAQDAQHAEVARQLALVAERREGLVGGRAGGEAAVAVHGGRGGQAGSRAVSRMPGVG